MEAITTFTTKSNHLGVIKFQPQGYYCGYVLIDKNNSLWGVNFINSSTIQDLVVHGGVTYSDSINKEHDYYPLFDKKYIGKWCIGFDANHYYDSVDTNLIKECIGFTKEELLYIESVEKSKSLAKKLMSTPKVRLSTDTVFRDATYIRGEVEKLSRQLKKFE
jgi:hypothetical protein